MDQYEIHDFTRTKFMIYSENNSLLAVTLFAKSSPILEENKAGFGREGHPLCEKQPYSRGE